MDLSALDNRVGVGCAISKERVEDVKQNMLLQKCNFEFYLKCDRPKYFILNIYLMFFNGGIVLAYEIFPSLKNGRFSFISDFFQN